MSGPKFYILEHRDVYRCPWCGKPYLRKQDVMYHINFKCRKNPEYVHPCFWCDQLEKKDARVQFEWIGGFGEYHEEFHDVPSFYCKKHDQWMYSRLACKHDHPCSKDGDHLPMPKECDDFNMGGGVPCKWDLEEFNGKPWYKKHEEKSKK